MVLASEGNTSQWRDKKKDEQGRKTEQGNHYFKRVKTVVSICVRRLRQKKI